MKPSHNIQEKSIIFFDDQCLFCKAWVAWIIRHDHQQLFSFGALSSSLLKEILPKHPYLTKTSRHKQQLLLLHDREWFAGFIALRKILQLLPDDDKSLLIKIFQRTPLFLGILGYQLVARYRYLFSRFYKTYSPQMNKEIKKRRIDI